MLHTPSKNGWLLGLCGVLDAMIAAIYWSHTGRGFTSAGTVAHMGMLTAAAGVCTVAAAILAPRRRESWLLALNGLACGALGLIFTFWTGPLAFRTVAILIAVMAVSIGVFDLTDAQALRRASAGGWLLNAFGVVSVGFALVFLAFVFHWIELEPRSPGQTLHWLGAYFGFSAICMLALALRLQGQGHSQSLREEWSR